MVCVGSSPAGRLIPLRRGVYALAPPFRKVKPHPFVSVNTLVQSSYTNLLHPGNNACKLTF